MCEQALWHYADSWQRHAALLISTTDEPLVLSPDEPVFVAGYEVSSEQGRGRLHILLRLAAWRRALPALPPTRPSAPAGDAANSTMLSVLGSCSLPVRAVLGRTTISVQDLLALQPGDILCLGTRPDDPVEIHVGNRPKLRGRAQVEDGHYIITISDPLSPEGATWI